MSVYTNVDGPMRVRVSAHKMLMWPQRQTVRDILESLYQKTGTN
jgi:hypothetical protein